MESPRDGDIIVTKDQFIFYVFGYDHPVDKVIAYLKYLPKDLKPSFQLSWLPYEWNLGDTKYIRARQLYSPENFERIQKVFKEKYPEYLYRDPYAKKTVFVVPSHLIHKIYVPEVQWQDLLKKSDPSPLEQEAIEIIKLLANNSGVHLADFGIHGSLSTGMSTEKSDVDIAIYGAKNYYQVKKTIWMLFKDKKLEYLNENDSDEYRMNKCIYKGRKFVFNGIRKFDEMRNDFGKFQFTPIRPLHFHCDVVESPERIFRPAIYNIAEYFPADDNSLLVKTHWPSQVVSMIGEFRDIARRGDEVEVQGMLEKVEKIKSAESYYRVVIGSGKGEEFIWPV
ncbi:MAG TPA: nucleotidyltransferase domain-containing protein [Candidatus Deferrimicrobium sp.]|nr:nucleotidyltransferase domain-containing protein [Candidatus Deferrimicrobium sp.]